ncbi:hypothetical protein [Janthinobacterium sp. JC611]|uniref:hypothetical protein n=1 Tax=Janthinobacterium sp. JC611 TaxID=2816201 RepID=UPI001BFE080B|nr:hypothetical protein [Janthinobacterium sp. JC611]
MTVYAEEQAFPAALRPAVHTIVQQVAGGAPERLPAGYRVVHAGEALLLPVRVYYPPAALLAGAAREGEAGLVALCLGTRHHDGHVRERCIQGVLERGVPWAMPFVLQALGDYVLPVVLHIEAGRAASARGWDEGVAARLAGDSPAWFATLERRAISYWNEYHRARYPQRQAYPACRVLAALRGDAALTPR